MDQTEPEAEGMLFAHQEAAFRSLLETARLCFSPQYWRSLPVRPRFARFVSGPSGCGKTHLAKALADHLEVPLYAVDASSWMPLGANGRGARTTWTELALWLRDNARGIILIDELDKVGKSEGWLNYVRVEIFSLLDRRLPAGISLGGDDENASPDTQRAAELKLVAQRLESAMIIGAGAFQSLWDSRAKPSMGFHAEKEAEPDSLTHRQMAQSLPVELANRFAGPILVIPPLREEDYVRILRSCAKKLPRPLATQVTRIGEASVREAVENQLGVRWLQEVLLKALIRASATRKEIAFQSKANRT